MLKKEGEKKKVVPTNQLVFVEAKLCLAIWCVIQKLCQLQAPYQCVEGNIIYSFLQMKILRLSWTTSRSVVTQKARKGCVMNSGQVSAMTHHSPFLLVSP